VTWLRLESTRDLVLALLPHLTWRHHGIGALQAYVREGSGVETRIHIWHPDLVRAGIRDHGDAHDHRFNLVSAVLVGELTETLYWPDANHHAQDLVAPSREVLEVVGDVTPERALEVVRSMWWAGPIGWVLDDVRGLTEPVPCRGALGLWTVPEDVAARVRLGARKR
jgi:hypothetical protein